MTAVTSALSRLVAPRRVALLGSLSKTNGLGSRTLRHLTEGGFTGEILTPATPAEMTGEVDVAVVAVPASAVADVVAELDGRCAFVIVNSSGFEEVGAPPIPRPTSTRLIGPNSVGLFYAPSSTALTFAAAFDGLASGVPDSGIFMISQSGAFGARLVQMADRYGVRFQGFVGTGNETYYGACEFARDLIASAGHRPRVIGLYLESVPDGAQLEAMLEDAASAEVAVVLLLGGSSALGAAAASSHSAAVSPDTEVVRELCGMWGAVFADSDRDVVESAIGLSLLPRARGCRVGVITGSGGAGVVGADILAGRGLQLPPLSAGLRTRLAASLPAYASTPNPVDVTAQVIGDDALVASLAATMATSGELDALLVVGRRQQAAPIADAVAAAVPTVVVVLDGTPESVADNLANREPVMPGLAAAATALRAVCTIGAPHGACPLGAGPRTGLPASVAGDAAAGLEAIAAAGVESAPWDRARSVEQARAVAAELGWPVVLKGNLPAATHKAQAGAVRLDVTLESIEAVADELLRIAPELIVAAQLRGGPELVVGVRRDPVLGPVVVAGLGGGHIELVKRTVSVPISASPQWLARRLREDVLQRGGPRYEPLAARLASVADVLAALFRAGDFDLIECNPLIPRDDSLVALDARVTTHD